MILLQKFIRKVGLLRSKHLEFYDCLNNIGRENEENMLKHV